MKSQASLQLCFFKCQSIGHGKIDYSHPLKQHVHSPQFRDHKDASLTCASSWIYVCARTCIYKYLEHYLCKDGAFSSWRCMWLGIHMHHPWQWWLWFLSSGVIRRIFFFNSPGKNKPASTERNYPKRYICFIWLLHWLHRSKQNTWFQLIWNKKSLNCTHILFLYS